MTQKSFLEMERPRRTTEFVVIVKEIDANRALGNCHFCSRDTDWACMCCGQWTCDSHEDEKESLYGSAICQDCAKLTKVDRQRVYQLRETLNEA